jgi:YesN/AraC family two-component response regulator
MEPSPYSSPAVSLLVVDDDGVTREVIDLMLSRKFPENTIYFADGGKKGVELFKKHTPAIVVTDIQMPEMDGIEMAGAIKAIKADTKFIALTAYGSTNYHEKFVKIGCHDFLLKPIEFEKLYAAIEKCFAEIMNITAEHDGTL